MLVECESPKAALFAIGLDPSNPHHLFHSDCWFFGSQRVILSDFSFRVWQERYDGCAMDTTKGWFGSRQSRRQQLDVYRSHGRRR
jgi:hypothetical protein